MKKFFKMQRTALFKVCSKKTFRIMKLTTVLLLATILNVFGSKSYSQYARLNLDMKDVPIQTVLNAIENQSEFFFLYSSKMIDVTQKVDIHAQSENIFEVLDELLGHTDIKYTVRDRQILLFNKEKMKDANLQQQIVTGTVIDHETGEPMPGVNILVKGTNLGTLSDSKGYYSINVSNNAILVFSFIGYITMEVPFAGNLVISVALVPDIMNLNEVIVIGYGTQKKSDLTGSVVRINMNGTEKAANTTILQALQGTTPGVNVTGGGQAGAEQQLSIRGQTSLSASDQPLIVIDGIIYNGAISDINIQDVESIDVLKDASAAAVYGSRSANGVMLITTKKGKTEKPLFNLNLYYGFQDMTNNPMKVMNGKQFAERMVDFYWEQDLYNWYKTNPTSDAGKPVRPDVTNPNIVVTWLRTQEDKDNYLAGKEIDWVKEVIRQAPIQNYDLSISGKTARSNYYLSGSFVDQKGILLNDQFNRTTLHTSFENKITDWFTMGVTSSYSYRDYSGLEASLASARSASPFANMYDAVGGYPMYLTGELYQPHPFNNLTVDNLDIRNNLFVIVNAKIEIPKINGLTYDFNYSNTYYTTKNNTFWPVTVPEGTSNKGLATKVLTEERSWIFNNILTYIRTFGSDHKLNATFLYSKEHRQGESTNPQATGFDNPVLIYNGMEFGTVPAISTGAWEEKSISYMGRANYTFKERYMITGTIRKDGFSGFGPNKKFATFPSLSLGWVASQEDFIKSVSWLDFLKLRASVGENGNQGIGRYSSFSKMGNTAYVYNGSTSVAVYPNSLGNADLGWESTLSYNLGLDYAFLKSRISGSIDLYKAQTSNVLVNRAIPGSTGYGSVWTNIGGISNKGLEIGLKTINIDGQLRWETRFQFSLNRDKITKLYGGANDMDIGNSWFVGKPISSIYDYKMTGGLWTEQELYNGLITTANFYPGQFKLADLNSDGAINPNDDRSVIGYQTPSYRFSINNSFSYKNFTLSFFLNSIQGGKDYYLANNSSVLMVSTTADHVYRENCTAVRQYWTPDNGVNNAPGIFNAPQRIAGLYQSRSFVRLQDVSLNYSFSPNLLKTLGLDALDIYINGKNIYTWTKWSGWDPETGSNTPLMRSIIGGIRLSF